MLQVIFFCIWQFCNRSVTTISLNISYHIFNMINYCRFVIINICGALYQFSMDLMVNHKLNIQLSKLFYMLVCRLWEKTCYSNINKNWFPQNIHESIVILLIIHLETTWFNGGEVCLCLEGRIPGWNKTLIKRVLPSCLMFIEP